jgi:hypothetical protein
MSIHLGDTRRNALIEDLRSFKYLKIHKLFKGENRYASAYPFFLALSLILGIWASQSL